jgi:glutaredoxin
MHDHEVILYTRQNCCLCDEAKQTLESYGLAPKLVDIDEHRDQLAKYNECVPVVEIDGKVHFRGKVNEVLLRRILH